MHARKFFIKIHELDGLTELFVGLEVVRNRVKSKKTIVLNLDTVYSNKDSFDSMSRREVVTVIFI